MKSDTLDRARAFIRRSQYREALTLLKGQSKAYQGSHDFFYLLSYCCLSLGDADGAQYYIERALKIVFSGSSRWLELLITLRSGERAEALAKLIRFQEAFPKDKRALRLLKALKASSEPDTYHSFLYSRVFDGFLPRERVARPPLPRTFWIVLLTIFLVLALTFGLSMFKARAGQGRLRTMPALSLSAKPAASQGQGEEQQGLQAKDERRMLKKLYKFVQRYEDNLARLQINKILLSKSSEQTKNKALSVGTFLKAPTIDALKNNFSFQDVVSSPSLYKNTYVQWRGQVVNLSKTKDGVDFDFIVRGDQKGVVDGAVHAHFNAVVRLDSSLLTELLGQVGVSKEGKISLKVSTLYQVNTPV